MAFIQGTSGTIRTIAVKSYCPKIVFSKVENILNYLKISKEKHCFNNIYVGKRRKKENKYYTPHNYFIYFSLSVYCKLYHISLIYYSLYIYHK